MNRLFILVFFCFISCSDQESKTNTNTLFSEVSNTDSGLDFQNTVTNSDNFNIFNYRNFYNGGGVAIGDINGDNLSDIYLTSNMGDNKLFLNKGDWQFEDISESANVSSSGKWSTGVVMVDVNQDGLLDIYVCNAGFRKGTDQRNQLYINNGDETFSEEASKYGLDENGYTTHAAFFDFDKDGDLDVYILNNSFIPTNTLNYANQRELNAEDWPVKDYLKGGGDKLLMNDDGVYKDISSEAGIYQSLIGFGLGITVGDVNNDNWPDLYVCNDFFERDYLYINNKKGGFEEKLESYFEHISHSSMGADMQDINNDGLPDLFVTDMMPRSDYRLKSTASFDDINLRRLKVKKGFYNQFMHNTLQVNAGDKFKDIAFMADVAASEWSWGALMFDADNDGLSDLLVCNGIYHDVIDLDFMDFFANDMLKEMALSGKKEEIEKIIENMPSVPVPNNIFKNINGYEFKEIGKEWGLDKPSYSNGAAYGDLDNDGDYDLVINNVNQPLSVYKNNSDNNSISVVIDGPSNNKFGIGSKIYVYSNNGIQYKQVYPSRGFQSSTDYVYLFGLGNDAKVDSIKVIWPDLKVSKISNTVDSSITVSYDSANLVLNEDSINTLFETRDLKVIEPHKEDDHVDYYNERGLYRLLSREGPTADLADVNADGLLDVFVGGAKGQSGSIYTRNKAGGYLKTSQPYLSKDKGYEDTSSKFLDFDDDGDMDLIVGSGGNHLEPNDSLLVDRIYVNNNGVFKKYRNPLSRIGMNTSVILPYDYDGDGDLDLFVGSRSVPKHFGYSPLHFLFNNDGKGNFTDYSNQVFDGFKGFGMVTDASLIDVDDDGNSELLIVGEWESPRLFKFDGTSFNEMNTNLSNLGGWYHNSTIADVNNDGKEDIIFGNTGANCYLSASESEPLKLWINDFDNNGFVDKVITSKIDGVDKPIHQKRDLADQIVSVKKQSMKNHDYATKSIYDLFDKSILDNCKVKPVTKMESYVALNRGDGSFEIIDLPIEAQASSIHTMAASDIDKDGDLDLIIGGNDHHFIPQFSRLDASYGGVLRNDGNGIFSYVSDVNSGINVNGETKEILAIDDDSFLFLRNNSSPKLITPKK